MKKIKFTFFTFEYENDANKNKTKKDNKKPHKDYGLVWSFLISFVAGLIVLAIQYFIGL